MSKNATSSQAKNGRLMVRCATMRPGKLLSSEALRNSVNSGRTRNDRRQHLARKHNQAQGHSAGIVAGEGIGDGGGERQSDDGRAPKATVTLLRK